VIRKKDVNLNSDGLRISGQIFFPDIKPLYPAVCICHGIPNDVQSATTDIKERGYAGFAERLCREGFAVLIFNFRGVGSSEGNFDLTGWTTDLKAAIRYLWSQDDIRRSSVYLLGFSAGGAVSICVAAEDRRISAVAACASPSEFESYFVTEKGPAPVVEHFRNVGIIRDKDFPPSPDEWLQTFQKVRPLDYVQDISPVPLLIVHGTADETVDVSNARKLYDKAGEPKDLHLMEGVSHRIRLDEASMNIVIDWLKERLPH